MDSTVENELIIIRLMAVIVIGISALVFLLLQFMTASYGRYSSWNSSLLDAHFLSVITMDGKLAWFLQELPALTIPIYCILFTSCDTLNSTTNKILIGMLLCHYAQR